MKNKQKVQNNENKATNETKATVKKSEAKSAVRDYYEAESWQFSACGD